MQIKEPDKCKRWAWLEWCISGVFWEPLSYLHVLTRNLSLVYSSLAEVLFHNMHEGNLELVCIG